MFSPSPFPPPVCNRKITASFAGLAHGLRTLEPRWLVCSAKRLRCLEQRTDGALPQPSSTSQSCFPKGDEATAAAIAAKPNRALDSSPDASRKSPRGTLVEDLLVGGTGQFASRGSCQPSQILCHSQLCCVHPGSEVWECWPLASDLPHDSNSKKQCPKSACNDSLLIPTAWLVKRSESTNRNWPDKSDFFLPPHLAAICSPGNLEIKLAFFQASSVQQKWDPCSAVQCFQLYFGACC